jgi:periplasmic protein TonB
MLPRLLPAVLLLLCLASTLLAQPHTPAQTSPTISPENAPRSIRISGRVMEANLLTHADPIYPQAAVAQKIKGDVKLTIVIDVKGVPISFKIDSSPSPLFSQPAINAVQQYRYKPVVLNGQQMSVQTDVTVSFAPPKSR